MSSWPVFAKPKTTSAHVPSIATTERTADAGRSDAYRTTVSRLLDDQVSQRAATRCITPTTATSKGTELPMRSTRCSGTGQVNEVLTTAGVGTEGPGSAWGATDGGFAAG